MHFQWFTEGKFYGDGAGRNKNDKATITGALKEA
jgi:hypothetical protein